MSTAIDKKLRKMAEARARAAGISFDEALRLLKEQYVRNKLVGIKGQPANRLRGDIKASERGYRGG